MSPALTRSPSRTRSSPTTPPVGCWTFLTLEFDHQRAGRDHRAGNLGGGGPAAEPEHQQADVTAVPPGSARRSDAAGPDGRSLMTRLRPCRLRLSGRPAGADRGAASWRRTSSLGPNALASPCAITSTWSTAASALGRCAITTAMPPRARTPRIALRQRLLALGVEVRVRLVQHHQERIADRARARAQCAGAARPRAPSRLRRSRSRSPAAGAGSARARRPLCRRDDRVRIGLRLEARDVLRDRAVEQLDVLRQIADVPAERLGRPLIERRAVEADAAAHRPAKPRPGPAPATTCRTRSGR